MLLRGRSHSRPTGRGAPCRPREPGHRRRTVAALGDRAFAHYAAQFSGSRSAPTDVLRLLRYLRRLVLGVVALALVAAGAGTAYELSLPGVSDAPVLVAAIVRAHHGQLGRLPLPAKLAVAIVAVEDSNFYQNVFANVAYGAGRAAVASVRGGGDPGGSTIEQQLAKQLYTSSRDGTGATLEQIGLGIKLALTYSKAEVLNMYLNSIYFGNGYWGYVAAARGYFGVAPSALTWAEATLLAGLPQAPSAYDPLYHLHLAKQRQREVLNQLVETHKLTVAQAATVYGAPLPLR